MEISKKISLKEIDNEIQKIQTWIINQTLPIGFPDLATLK